MWMLQKKLTKTDNTEYSEIEKAEIITCIKIMINSMLELDHSISTIEHCLNYWKLEDQHTIINNDFILNVRNHKTELKRY